ncbi:hypothetical protein QQ008_21040 [Fulvivirgaceae bacterium BMA10]|uniref:Uncharacterized protein n=1 Tax=Splendidivirga corallicola TaxID=3051826 RepID=A0ABT8KT30_9BACT|nr:hypothetical protein [Fulvivirgaceae bacterium BMA10]
MNGSAFGYFFVLINITLLPNISAQSGKEQTHDFLVGSSLETTFEAYEEKVGRGAHIFNGHEYVPLKGMIIIGHEFFLTEYLEPGDIVYEGNFYRDIEMLYDCHKDEILIAHYSQRGRLVKIRINKDKVEEFRFMGHYFKHLRDKNVATLNFPGSGFYDLLYDNGKNGTRLLVKRIKGFQDRIEEKKLIGEFEQKDRFYIIKNNTYERVRKKKSLLKVFEDKKKEIKSYVKKQKLDFKRDQENAILQIVKFYDQSF